MENEKFKEDEEEGAGKQANKFIRIQTVTRAPVLCAAFLFLFDSFPFAVSSLYVCSRIQTHRYLVSIYVEHLHMMS